MTASSKEEFSRERRTELTCNFNQGGDGMAATTSQGRSFTGFIVSLTVATAGLAFWSTGMGKAALALGVIGLVATFVGFLRIKAAEGKVPSTSAPAVLKLAGLALAVGGWVLTLFGLHLSTGVGGRMTTTLIGVAVTLIGVIGLLPMAANKNAIWKA
jgi:hypothetical protein